MFIVAAAVAGAISGFAAYVMALRRHATPITGSGAALVCTIAASALSIGVAAGSRDPWTALVAVHLTARAVPLAVVDALTGRLPRAAIYGSYPPTMITLATAALGANDIDGLQTVLLAGILLTAVFYGAALLGELGAGDVRLAPVIGAHLGWAGLSTLAAGVLLAFGIGTVVVLIGMAANRTRIRTRMPFAPALFAGAIAALLL